jgi:uncharacterized protein (DUF1697 family)
VAQQILLLRGINLASRNRIAMPKLRDVLAGAGFADVRTYLQSGNIVLSSNAKPEDVAHRVKRLITKEFGLDVPVVSRTRGQLVSFLDSKPTRDVVERVERAAVPPEQVVVIGREIYAWHPDAIARSRLWTLLAGQKLGVTATARNWTTVTSLLALADD